MRSSNQHGIALITVLLVMALMSALLVGFTVVVMSDQRYRFIDRDRGQAFYGANAGVEKLTGDLGNLFFTNLAPTAAQITALTGAGVKPVIAGVTFVAPAAPDVLPTSSLLRCVSTFSPTNYIASAGTAGYTIKFCATAAGVPTTVSPPTPIKTGPYEGLVALQSPYQIDVSAKTSTGGEVHLVRTMESVAIPVFQFGMFSDTDLSFFAGPDFNFGGRIHTNGTLFLGEGDGQTLTLGDKVTAVNEVNRQDLANGVTLHASGHDGTVNMAMSAGVYRALAQTEGSVKDGAQNEPTWHSISLSTYNSWIRNGRTGAKVLNLPLITAGGSNPDLVRRPAVGENTSNPILFGERLFNKASLRVLLSDTAADITNLPGVTTATAPVLLDGNWRTAAPTGYTVDASHPPIARSPGLTTTATTSGSVSLGTGKTITLSAAMPAAWQMPTLKVHKNTSVAAAYDMTCTGKDPTHLYGCKSPATPYWPVYSSTTPIPTIDLSITTVDVTPLLVLSALTPTSTLGTGSTTARDITLTSGSTMPYSVNTFFVGGNLITCSGYTATTLTGCNVRVDIASGSTVTTGANSPAGTGTVGGYIKVERGNVDGTWTDVTLEILNYGIGGPNIVNGAGGANLGGTACADPTPNAILRIQRLKDNNWSSCTYAAAATTPSTDYWPNVLFDTREALQRDCGPGGTSACTAAGSVAIGGVMYYVAIDAANLSKWFKRTAPFAASTGNLSKTDNSGYTVYFSDRRNNRNASSLETGEYGWEDFVNSASSTGTPDNAVETGENVNGSLVNGNPSLDVYGGVPNYTAPGATATNNTVVTGATAPYATSMRPTTTLTRGQAQVNRAVIFRHALKLIKGDALASFGITGLTVVSENPVYIQGNWNAASAPGAAVTTANFVTNAHAATSVIADAVTLLSNNWNDDNSFAAPYDPGSRLRVNAASPTTADSWYRVAIIGGKGIAFPHPAGTADDFGTDGGVHNFLRYLENGDAAVNYRGAIATFFYNRQAVGTYKCCTTVYGAPTRNYAFDSDFLTPALLPPNTPVFRDLNAVGFSQDIRPGK